MAAGRVFARCGRAQAATYVSDFFLYRLVSFVHSQIVLPQEIREIYEYRRMGETTRAMAPEGLGWAGLSPQAEDANSPSNWPNMTSNAGRYSSGKPARQFSGKTRSANEVTSSAPFE